MDDFARPETAAEVQPPVEVPAEALSAEALQGVIENFVLREGTDYGVQEVSHEAKIERVRRQLAAREVRVVFDPNTESVSLLRESELRKLLGSRPDLVRIPSTP